MFVLTKRRALVVLLTMLTALVSSPISAADTSAPGTFISTADLVDARTLHTATRLPDGRVLIVGGVSDDRVVTASAELYDPATDTFTPTGSMAHPRWGHSATLLGDGTVLIVGGSPEAASGAPIVRQAERYDPRTGAFASAGSTIGSKRGHAAALLNDGSVLLVGGFDAFGQPASVPERFDPTNDSFRSTNQPAIPEEVLSTAVTLHDGTVLVTGRCCGPGHFEPALQTYDPETDTYTGISGTLPNIFAAVATRLSDGTVLFTGVFTGTVLRYDPARRTFDAVAKPATARLQPSATLLIDGTVLVAGGTRDDAVLASADAYDATADTWFPAPPMIEPRIGHTATLLSDGRVLIAGGTQGINGFLDPPLASAELFIPGGTAPTTLPSTGSGGLAAAASGTFIPVGDMSIARINHAATLLADGRVLVTGGGGSFPITSTEIFDPATRSFTPAGDMTQPHLGHAAIARADGSVLIAGSWVPNQRRSGGPFYSASDSTEIFDPVTGTFRETEPMQFARFDAALAPLPDGDLLLIGGSGAEGPAIALERFDHESETYTTVARIPGTGVNGHSAHVMSDGTVLVFGWHAEPGDRGEHPSVLRYDPITQEVSLLAVFRRSQVTSVDAASSSQTLSNQQQGAMSDVTAAAIRTKENPLTSTLLGNGSFLVTAPGKAWLFSPATARVSEAGPFASATRPETANLLPDGRVLLTSWVFRGLGDEGVVADLYDPRTNTFAAIGEVPNVGAGRTATSLPDGFVLFTGGQIDQRPLAGAALFLPTRPTNLPATGSGGLADRGGVPPWLGALLVVLAAFLVALVLARRRGIR